MSRRSSRSSVAGGWTARSDAKLRRLVGAGAHGPTPTDWKAVAREMQGWSAKQCETRYKQISSWSFVEDGECVVALLGCGALLMRWLRWGTCFAGADELDEASEEEGHTEPESPPPGES